MGRFEFKLNMERSDLFVVVVLAAIMALAFFLRTYWAVGPSIEYGYAVSGGSDSYYHEKILDYILSTGHQLLRDPMLNYPIGVNNPRPPLFHWAIIYASFVFYPFLSPTDSAYLMLILFPAIWGTLTIIPVYLFGKEAFNRKIGLIAAFLLAVMPAHLMRSVATQADWDAFDLFFVVTTFYFYFKALKTVKYRRWIKDWFKRDEVKRGLKQFYKESKKAIVYAALAGTSLGSLAIAWKGFTYAEGILAIYIVIQLFLNRFMNKSNLHLTLITTIFTLFAFALPAPWYLGTDRAMDWIMHWYGVPLFLMLFIMFIGFYLEITSKYPWPFAFLVAALIIGGTFVVLNFVDRTLIDLILSGQGYFVKSKLYSTIAEAQPATLGVLAMSFGVATFFLAFFGIARLIYLMRKKFNEAYIFFVIYSVVAIYMAISAARFIFNAAPAFALASGIAIVWFLDMLDIKGAIKEFKSPTKSLKKSFKKSVKFSHVVGVLLIAVLVVLPNVWSAVDAGIPYETKKEFDKQIYNSMPDFLRPNESTYKSYAPWYLGAFGYSLPKDTYPWPRAWKWLSEQDTNEPPQDRPAFVSWWDYGFEAVREGKHPTVADNFQNGYQIAAQIITAQNESEVISLFIARFLEANYAKNGGQLSSDIYEILVKYVGEEKTEKIDKILADPHSFRYEVLDNPQIYGYYSSDISDENVKYVAIKGILAYLPQHKLISIYDGIRNATGWDIRYFAVDYRLFPFSGRNTGIFYAPAKLGDRRIEEVGGTVIPYDFYTLKAVDSYGNEYDLDKIPANVHIVDYKIEYKPMFYHSMLYRTFIGYSGQDVGASDGIPGISPTLQGYYPMQAWNMTHFKLVYRTAYWNPYKDYKNHSKDWKPIPIDLALKYKEEGKGTVELNPPAAQVLPSDVVMVKFYEGAVIRGRITLSTGEPLKHVRVTLVDEYGIPHATVLTDDEGYYRILSVAGNITLVVSTNGGFDKLHLVDKTTLYQTKIHVSEEQAMRLKPNYTIIKNIEIKPSNVSGVVYYDLDHNGYVSSKDKLLLGATVILRNETYGVNMFAPMTESGYMFRDVPPHKYSIDVEIDGKIFKNLATVTVNPGSNVTQDIKLQPSYITGTVTYANGTVASNVTVVAKNQYTTYSVNTATTGTYKLMVVPENYTLYAYTNGYHSERTLVELNTWNVTKTNNITLKRAFLLTAKVTYNDIPVADAVVKIKGELVPHNIRIIRTNANGEFSVYLPGGIYSIYVLGDYENRKIVRFMTVNLAENMDLNIALYKAYKLSGYITPENTGSGAEISIFPSETNFYRIYANNTGYFEVYLPSGTYNLGFVAFNSSGAPYFARKIISLNQDKEISVTLHTAYNVTGYVYYDSNHNGIMDSSETIKNGLVMLYDSQGVFEVRNIPPDGEFKLVTNINYNVKAMLYGYEETNVAKVNGSYEIQVVPWKVSVEGKLYRDGKLNDIPVNVTFSSVNYTTSVYGVKGTYSVQLPPGVYNVTFWGYGRMYKYPETKITVENNEMVAHYDLNFTALVKVNVESLATDVIWYQNGKKVTTGKIVDIAPGNYTLYGRNGTYAAIEYVSITQNTTLPLILYPGYYVDFSVENYTDVVPVNVTSGQAKISLLSSNNIFLPEGIYTFVSEFEKFENGKYYRYECSITKQIYETTTVVLNVTREVVLGTVEGIVYVDNIPAANAVIHFIAMDYGKENVTVSTDSNGHYSAQITPGRYMIYTWYVYGGKRYAYIDNITVSKGIQEHNITYSTGYLVSGGIYLKGAKVSANIRISSEYGFMYVMGNQYYFVVLPEGKYLITSQITRKEYGLEITYEFSKNIVVNGTTYLDIDFKRVSTHDIEISVLSKDSVAKPGEEYHIMLYLKNKGNDVENVTFESFGGWNVVHQDKVSLYPGESQTVVVTLSVPTSVSYGTQKVTLRAKYGATKDIQVSVFVGEYYNTTANYTMSGWTDNHMDYLVTITNNGNTNVNYTLTILNEQELYYKGWNVEIIVDGKNVSYIKVSPKDSETITVRLVAIKDKPSTVIPVELEILGSKPLLINLEPSYPAMSATTVYINGTNLENYTAFEIPPEWYAIWAAIIVLSGIIGYLWRRKR